MEGYIPLVLGVSGEDLSWMIDSLGGGAVEDVSAEERIVGLQNLVEVLQMRIRFLSSQCDALHR